MIFRFFLLPPSVMEALAAYHRIEAAPSPLTSGDLSLASVIVCCCCEVKRRGSSLRSDIPNLNLASMHSGLFIFCENKERGCAVGWTDEVDRDTSM